MNSVQVTSSILSLIAGVGVFLIACNMMSSNLEAIGSGKLKALFSKTTKSKLVGVGVGTVTTALIQSSSATSVMVIGFVNAGIMTLSQAASVIYGANIGTTITGQLVALGMFGGESISTSVIFATLAGVGAFILAFSKNDKLQKIGGILSGFGLLFVGLDVMSNSMEFFSELESVKLFLAQFTSPIVLVLIGAVITGIIQSSSVMTSMTITMVVTGLINLDQGVFITMGANIGTCVTALLAGITSTRNAKRTALIHMIFNISGVVVFMLASVFMGMGGITYGTILETLFPGAPQLQMSMFHTIFNVITVACVLPLNGQMVKLVTLILPDRKSENGDEMRLKFVEEHMLATPSVAVLEVKNEILYMAGLAHLNFNAACGALCGSSELDVQAFNEREETIDFTNKELNRFIARLLNTDELGQSDRTYLSAAIRTVSDLERVGDYAENATEYYEKLRSSGESFSPTAITEITALVNKINELYDLTVAAYRDSDASVLPALLEVENDIDDATDEAADGHIKRLERNECTPEVGAQFLSLVSNVERVADHYVNVAKTVKHFA